MINGGVDGGAGSVNYYLDGGTNMTGLRNTGNIAPNPDAVQEFRVITNSYSAEFGRFAGGVVNIVTRSGTNEFHGSLFEFLRNDKLNANYLQRPDQSASPPQPVRRRLLAGRSNTNKTFFFFTYSGLRQAQTQFFNNAVVPTALERAGNFSADQDATHRSPHQQAALRRQRDPCLPFRSHRPEHTQQVHSLGQRQRQRLPGPGAEPLQHRRSPLQNRPRPFRTPPVCRQLLRNQRTQCHPAGRQPALVGRSSSPGASRTSTPATPGPSVRIP